MVEICYLTTLKFIISFVKQMQPCLAFQLLIIIIQKREKRKTKKEIRKEKKKEIKPQFFSY